MGEVIVAGLSAFVAAAALVLAHPPIAAGAIGAVTIALFAARRGVASVLVDAFEALGVAAIGITIAATSEVPLVICAGAGIAFAAVVQQYAALVYARLAGHREALVGAPLGFVTNAGFVVFLACDQPPLLLVAIACWALVDGAWSATVRGVAVASIDRARPVPRPPRVGIGQRIAASRWPGRVSVASLACALGAATAIALATRAGVVVALVAARIVLATLDGWLARHRVSRLGAYLDKVSGLFAWGAMFAGLGLRAYATTARTAMLLLPLVAALVLALAGFARGAAHLVGQGARRPHRPALPNADLNRSPRRSTRWV